MKNKQEALAHMRAQISEDSKLSPIFYFGMAFVLAGVAIGTAAAESFIMMAVSLVGCSVLMAGGAVVAITRIYFKPLVEYWLAEEGDSTESKRAELQAELDALD